MEPTKTVLHQMEQLLARFFWGSTNDKKKTHWIGWEQCCRPVAEGGLGLRKFEDTVLALSCKLWWSFREQNSLWAKFLFRKYCSYTSPFTHSSSSRISPIWRRKGTVRDRMKLLTKWSLGDGMIGFWDDIWLGEGTLRQLCLSINSPNHRLVRDFWKAGQWDIEKLEKLHDLYGLPLETIEKIRGIPIEPGEHDRPRWEGNANEDFSVASVWDKTRVHFPVLPFLEGHWTKGVTPTMAIFIWRLLMNRVPVDTKLQWRHINMASKCRCCHSPKIESRSHLFIHSEAATKAWGTFTSWFPDAQPLPVDCDDLVVRLNRWRRYYPQADQLHLSSVIPCLIMWFLWSERNHCIHHNEPFRPDYIIWRVTLHLRGLVMMNILKPSHWRGCEPGVNFMPWSASYSRRTRIDTIVWKPPDPPWIKVNTDGAYHSNQEVGGGGGVIRDPRGELVTAFSFQMAATSGMEAELAAITRGLELATRFGDHIWVESDVEVVVRWLNSGKRGPANHRHNMARIRIIMQHSRIRFSHIPREGNRAADFMAKQGVTTPEFTLVGPTIIRPFLRAILRMDQRGYPSFCSRRVKT